MEAMNLQMTAIADEMATLRSEIISIKTAHASLHQNAVEANAANARSYGEQADRLSKLQQKVEEIADGPDGAARVTEKSKQLIEPKNVEVKIFAGSMQTTGPIF